MVNHGHEHQIHFQVLFAGYQPIPTSALPSEILRTVVDRIIQTHNISVPATAREVVWEHHGQGGPQRTSLDESRTIDEIGVKNGDKFAVSWAATNG